MNVDEPDGLDAATVRRMAMAYLTRYSASSHSLRRVLERKIRRWFTVRRRTLPAEVDTGALLDRVIEDLTRIGLVDDNAFALSRARRLVEKGLPSTRIRTDLKARGLDPAPDAFDDILEHDSAAQARRFAARKRLGPFRSGPRAPFRDKDVRAMIRAGFAPREAIAIIQSEGDEGIGSGLDPTDVDE